MMWVRFLPTVLLLALGACTAPGELSERQPDGPPEVEVRDSPPPKVLDADGKVDCERNEQEGCLTFQVVGIEYDAELMEEIDSMSRAKQAKTLGERVYEGMKSGRFTPAGSQEYVMYIWMKPHWNGSFPRDRMKTVTLAERGGRLRLGHEPIQWVTAESGQEVPTIASSEGVYAHLDQPDFALTADVGAGGWGVGWAIPHDIVEQMAYVLICPTWMTAYPNRVTERMGIALDKEEMAWYLKPKNGEGPDEFRISAVMSAR